MRCDDVTTDQRLMSPAPAAFHREHYARLIAQLEAQSFAEDDRLYAAGIEYGCRAGADAAETGRGSAASACGAVD